jgi:glycosyltransferase involved in cell wall biosynthesis
MNVIFVYADKKHEWNCSEWRCKMPADALNKSGKHHASLIDKNAFQQNIPEAQAVLKDADVIVIQRDLWGTTLPLIQYWKDAGKTVIVDFDDAYQYTHPSNISYAFWIKGEIQLTYPDGATGSAIMTPPPLEQFRWGLSMCDAVTMPSKVLCKDWSAYADTRYLPNYIDAARYTSVLAQEHEGIIIGWGGSVSHFQSFTESGVLAALKRVCKALPQVKVMICGDKRVADQITIPDGQKIFQPFVPVNEWPKVLSNFDIGLAPLQGLYDDRRSWIKVLEYMVMKIPWVASAGAAYQELSEYGRLVKNTPKNWESAILEMVDHLAEAREIARGKSYQYGIAQDVNSNVDAIVNIYQDIVKGRK